MLEGTPERAVRRAACGHDEPGAGPEEAAIRGLPLSDEAVTGILGGNAARILRRARTARGRAPAA